MGWGKFLERLESREERKFNRIDRKGKNVVILRVVFKKFAFFL